MSSYPPLDVSAEIQQVPPDPNLFTATVRNIDTSAPVNTLYGNLSSDAGGATIFQSDVSGLDSMQFPVDLTSYPPGFYTVFAITSDPAQTGEIVIYGGGAIPVPPIPSGRRPLKDRHRARTGPVGPAQARAASTRASASTPRLASHGRSTCRSS